MDRTNEPREWLTPRCRLLVRVWRSSYETIPWHPAGRCLAEAALHALLVDLRRSTAPRDLFVRHFDRARAHADLVLLASLVPPAPAARTLEERTGPLFPIREAAFWVRWCELTGGRLA